MQSTAKTKEKIPKESVKTKKEKKSMNVIIEPDEILDKFDIFSQVYSSSDDLDFDFIDSDESTSSTNLKESKKKNALSLTVHNIINIYPNHERNKEFKKYQEKKLEEKRLKQLQEEKEKLEKEKKKLEELKQKKLLYKIEKSKQKLVERKKFNKDNIEYNYLMIKHYYDFLMKEKKYPDVFFSFHDLYISPMRLYYFTNMNIDEIYYLDLSRRWLPDTYISIILDLCKQKKVKNLNLSFNKITHISLNKIAQFMNENKYLFSLNIENNNLTNSGNNPEGVNTLFESIKKNKCLSTLNIANTNMNQNNGEALCNLIKNNKNIIEVNFENNQFTHTQCRSIIQSLMENKKCWLKLREIEKIENERMKEQETYIHTYNMAVEASINEIENRERRKKLNKEVYINMWREEMKEKEEKEQEILESLEKKHEARIKKAQKKKLSKKKK